MLFFSRIDCKKNLLRSVCGGMGWWESSTWYLVSGLGSHQKSKKKHELIEKEPNKIAMVIKILTIFNIYIYIYEF